MPINVWDNSWLAKMGVTLPPTSAQEKRKRLEQLRQERDEAKERRQFQDELLKMWGYKPWKRIDRRKRPLRTKRSWVSYRARFRELDIVRLRCAHGLTFRAIGKKLGISHVSAWRRFEWWMENTRLEEEYRVRCLREIRSKMEQMDELEPILEVLALEERQTILRARGLIP